MKIRNEPMRRASGLRWPLAMELPHEIGPFGGRRTS
jgi:hypothetical protein